MENASIRLEFIESSIKNYKQNLCHIFPIPDLDNLLNLYTHKIDDARLQQLPFVIALSVMISLDKSLKELSSQSHAGNHIEQLDCWMTNTRIKIELSTPTLPVVRALLLAALCYEYNGSTTIASDCFTEATNIFNGTLCALGGLDGLQDRLPADEFCDLILTSWDFSNFQFPIFTGRRPNLLPLVHLNLGIVQEKYGRQAVEILLKKWSWIDLKVQISNLPDPPAASGPLLAMLRSFEALKPTHPAPKEVIYPTAYLEYVHYYAYVYYKAVSIYHTLSHEAQQEVCPKLLQCAQSYKEFLQKVEEHLGTVQSLERKRLILLLGFDELQLTKASD
ncbi:uncharacterized protein FMAN_02068 [Fusarium mangiferae]|uniref:Uncharacterized protein n=1 Tax=Fusarium mangiferae TaxID=192010 RepID=A0A1L7SL61_FUSMA|nr:uncharacterized protein FMAN_02068 [Fusarium mangiferae]CVK85163.1 uncharacterized protein FMAN_02068 [Fusarium mangiferae]